MSLTQFIVEQYGKAKVSGNTGVGAIDIEVNVVPLAAIPET